MGLTGMACSAAPGTSSALSEEPVSSDTMSYGIGRRAAHSTHLPAKSNPIAASW